MLKKNVKITGVRLILHVAEGRPKTNIRLAYNLLTLRYLTMKRFFILEVFKSKMLRMFENGKRCGNAA